MDLKPDFENYEVTFSIASGEPYLRHDPQQDRDYYEVLVVTPDAVDLSRLNGGASILKNHDPDKVLGTVVRAWIEEGKVWVRARFRKNYSEAVSVFKDAVDGTLRNVSTGYSQDAVSVRTENGIEFRDVTRWTIYEASVAVGVPADPTVGFYRSITLNNNNKRSNDMSEDEKKRQEEEAAAKKAAEEQAEKACGEEAKEKACEKRAAEIRQCAPATEIRSFNKPRREPITVGTSRPYSIARAFQSLVRNDIDASVERGVSNELYRDANVFPSDNSIMLSFRDGEFIDAPGNGAGLVGVEHRGDLFVEALRTRMGVKNATIIGGLRTPVSIPVQTGVSEVGIKGLDAAVDRTKPTVGSIEMRPKKIGAETIVGRSLLLQGIPNAIDIVIRDLEAEIARKLDITILHGDTEMGVAGVDGTTGVQNKTIASLASTTWGDVLAMYGKVADYEIEDGSLEWIAKGPTKALLMSIPKETHTGRFICDEDGTVNGYKLNVCGRCSGEDLYLGYWPAVYVMQWGGLEIQVDPYTGMSYGNVKIVANLYADVAITKPAAFVKRVATGSY